MPAPDVRPCIAVLGLGEAGSEIARDLVVAGAVVRGFDPQVSPPQGILACTSESDAAHGSDLCLNVNSAHDASQAMVNGLEGGGPATLWADLNTASAGMKLQLAQLADDAGVEFVDVALMAPVPGKGLRTPMLVSGPGVNRFSQLMGGLGADIEILDGPPGAAATRKLLRSVFFKGLAAAVVESLQAATAAGCHDWLYDNISRELAAADESTVRRLEAGTYQHAKRRAQEMAAASELLAELGIVPSISRASQHVLEGIVSSADVPTA